MKTRTKGFLTILLILSTMAGCNKNEVIPEPEIPEVPSIPQEDFPDKAFYDFILKNFDTDKDGIISMEEANNVRQIDCSSLTNPQNYFTSLKGFEHFPNLEKLNLNKVFNFNGVPLDLDLSKNVALTELIISDASIKTVNISNSPLLKIVRADNSKMETLDVSRNTLLEILDISRNGIKNIDLSKNTVLKELYCDRSDLLGENYTKMAELDVSANVLLKVLDCRANVLAELDVSKNTLLEVLNCSANKLTKIDITKNPELKDVDISENDIAFLNLTQNNELKKLNTSNTKVPFLDIKNTLIDTLYCCAERGLLSSLDAKGSKTLKLVECSFVEKLDVSESSIETIVFRDTKHSSGYYPQKTTFLLNNCPNLKEYYYRLDIEYSRGSEEAINAGDIDLDISHCASLTKFYSNILQDIKIDNCPKLKELTCKGVFDDIDLSGDAGLENVYLYSPSLKTVDLKDCASLTDVYCFGAFETIDLSGNKNIRRLKLVNKELTALNIDALINLEYLNIAVAPLDETLNITKNVKLEEITVRDSAALYSGYGEIKLHVADLPSLKYLQNSSKSLVDLKIDNCEKLESVLSNRNGSINPGKLVIGNCSGLRKVDCSYGKLSEVDIRNCGNLDSLNLYGNELASFQYNDSKNLTYLNCTGNKLKSLDISGITGLKELHCGANAISNLTVNNCFNIEMIYCENNQILSLRVDSLLELRDLYCSGNRLTSLDISNNPVMDKLDCTQNPDLATLYMSKTQNCSVLKKDGHTEIKYTD
ncbi:MAG: hypothetical protein LBC19_01855 [Tannerella sp.]|jgi:Leucine-rich repeat (LRR) protein|nr:hypothetical protein [Tannerella sp.]